MILRYKSIDSTQARAKEMRNLKPWTVILAEEQKSGYGRKKREWFSPPGGLYFSVILPESHIKDLQILTILAAFLVARTIKEEISEKTGLEPFIKLPNDVYLNQKKICGILTENIIGRKVHFSAMGIGLNTNIDEFPEDLEKKVTSLRIELGRKVDNEKIFKKILAGLKEKLETISR